MSKKSRITRKSWLLTVILAAALLLLPHMKVWAAQAGVAGTVVSENNIYIYVRGVSGVTEGSTVQIGTAQCTREQITISALAGLEVPMRTLILVDNSLSIPKKNRSDIDTILRELINRALPGEQIRLGTFSRDVTYLCEFSTDTAALLACVDGLQYMDQETCLNDALYQAMADLKADKTSFYTRVILISDGVDNRDIGYTNDEVRKMLTESGIPVYSVGTVKNNNSSELEIMFSYSRASNAEHYLLNNSASADQIAESLLEDQNNICIRITPDPALMDGSNKKILLNLHTNSGVVELTASADMPFGTVTPTPEPTPEPTKKPEKEPEATPTPLPVIGGNQKESDTQQEESEGSGLGVLLIIIGSLLGLVLILVAILLLIRRSNAKKAERERIAYTSQPQMMPYRDQGAMTQQDSEDSGTEVLSLRDDTSGHTVGLWDAVGMGQPRKYLVIKSADGVSVLSKTPIQDRLLIGRKNADIVIDDRFVSSRHCEIILRGEDLSIKDLGSSNGTYYADERVYDETPITSGGRIRLGKNDYIVELVKE